MTLSGLNSPRAEFPIKLYAGDILFFHSPEDDIYGQGVSAPVYGIDWDKQSHAWTGVTVENVDTYPWSLSVIKVLNPLPGEPATVAQTVCINTATTELYEFVVLIYRGSATSDIPDVSGDYLHWSEPPSQKLGTHVDAMPFSASKAIVIRKSMHSLYPRPYEWIPLNESGQGHYYGDHLEADPLVSEVLSWSQPFDEFSAGFNVLTNELRDGTVTASPVPAWVCNFPDSVWNRPNDPNHWSERSTYGRLETLVLTTSRQPITHRPTLGTTSTRTAPMMIASYQGQYRFWLSAPVTQTHVQRLRLQALNTPVIGPSTTTARPMQLSSPAPMPEVAVGRIDCVGRWEGLVEDEVPLPFQLRDGDWLLVVPHLLAGGQIRVEGFTTQTPQGVFTNIIDNFPEQRRVVTPGKHCKFVVDGPAQRTAHIVCWVYRGFQSSDIPSASPFEQFELSADENPIISAYDNGRSISNIYGNINDCCIIVIALHGSKNPSPDVGKPFLADYYEEDFREEWIGPVGDHVGLPPGQEPYVRLYEFRSTYTLPNTAYFGDGQDPVFPPEQRWGDWGFMWYLTFFFPTRQLPFHSEDENNPAPTGIARLPG